MEASLSHSTLEKPENVLSLAYQRHLQRYNNVLADKNPDQAFKRIVKTC